MNDTQEEIKRKVEKQTTITVGYGAWKKLNLIKLHENYETIQDVIYMLLNTREAIKFKQEEKQ